MKTYSVGFRFTSADALSAKRPRSAGDEDYISLSAVSATAMSLLSKPLGERILKLLCR
jgi:hypothetical protein